MAETRLHRGSELLPIVTHRTPLTPETDGMIAASARDLALRFASVWRDEPVSTVTAVELITLNRLGGEPGYSGSQFFVAALHGTNGSGGKLVSLPLLLKLVENDEAIAEKLKDELHRYESVRHSLPSRAHARPLSTYPAADTASKTRLLWSYFVDERTASGLPPAPPKELRHVLEQHRWNAAADSLRAAYRILATAHQGRKAKICYYKHYSPYLRLRKGWLPRLRRVVGDKPTIVAMGTKVSNPLVMLDYIARRPSLTNGLAHVSAVHGDLHPKNILVDDVFNACLIDFGWANGRFHTIVDFAFMEASIKFFRLPWHASRADIIAFERGLADSYGATAGLRDRRLQGAHLLISTIRKMAVPYLDQTQPDWFVRQYLLPVFFVTVGLFPYAASVVNLEHLLLSSGLLAARIEAILGR